MTPVVETADGKVRGRSGSGALVFRGLRYGADTGGGNRFLPPRPVARWKGIVDALRPGASAPQLRCPENTDPFYAWYSAIGDIGEDCLFLDVFTPDLVGGRPVLVWIHGGGWSSYSGTAPGFDGSALARQEDVVVVTVNHRLGIFGHLVIEAGDERYRDSGNVGLLDLVAALEWVRDNISRFGGDPACVTVFGESGGGNKIAALMTMRRAQGLFHRAVIQSTGSGMKIATFEEAARTAASIAQTLGAPRLDPDKLRTLSIGTLLEAGRRAWPLPRAVIDGRSFDSHPFDGAAPATAIDMPLMVGCTMTECSYYMRGDSNNFDLATGDVLRRLQAFLEVDPDRAIEIAGRYRDVHPDVSPSDLLVLVCSDYMFKRPTYGIGELQARSARAPVYAYHFEWRSPVEGGRMGSPHTSEVPFVFGTLAAARACVGDGSLPLMRRMMASWAAFARTGNPSGPDGTDWPPFDGEQRWTMCFDRDCRLLRDPGGAARNVLTGLAPYFYGKSMLPMTSG